MKKLSALIVIITMSISVNAQSPQKMSYQAVIRDASNVLITSHVVGMRISILQGSVSGPVVYTEIQTPSTNANGLVSIEIGGGTGFDAIDWANGPYFIKTETDPTGGTNYTAIVGTSQLLSVPYALYAKTSETSTNAVTITGDNIIDGVKTFTGTITVPTPVNATDAANKAYVDNLSKYEVGEFAQGGIVFWIDETGQHGLVCAKTDQSTDIRWYAGTNGNTQAKGDGPFSGEANTTIIIAAHVAIGDDGTTYAARMCNELQITEGGKTYGDWYLPSKEELNLMYQNKSAIDATAAANGGSAFAGEYYLSSTEFNPSYAWNQHFLTGYQNYALKSTTYCVRAIRSF